MAKQQKKTQVPHTVVVFGPPSSGVSRLLEVLSGASELAPRVVPYAGMGTSPLIGEARDQHKHVLVDVDGGLLTPDDVHHLVRSGMIHMADSTFVRAQASHEDCLERASDRPEYVSLEDLKEWDKNIVEVEDAIRSHDLPYYMIMNDDLESAVRALAIRIGLTR